MGTTLSKDSYVKIIEQDLDFLNKYCPDSLELDHIKLIMCKSIDDVYQKDILKTHK